MDEVYPSSDNVLNNNTFQDDTNFEINENVDCNPIPNESMYLNVNNNNISTDMTDVNPNVTINDNENVNNQNNRPRRISKKPDYLNDYETNF